MTVAIVSALLFWSMLELGIAVIAICLPSLRVLVQKESTESIVRGAHGVWRSFSASIGSSMRVGPTKGDESRSVSMETLHRKITSRDEENGVHPPQSVFPGRGRLPCTGKTAPTNITVGNDVSRGVPCVW